MIEKVINKDNMNRALNMLLTDKNHRGYDEVNTHDLPEFLRLNLDDIIASIRDGTYKPGKVNMFEHIDKHGKTRLICNMCAIDRLLTKSIYIVIYDIIAPMIHKHSFAFQKGKALIAAAKKCREHVTCGNPYVVQLDIMNFYETIDRSILKDILTNTLQDNALVDLIMKLLTADVFFQHQIIRSTRGIIQGCTISPIISELYLTSLDQYMQAQGYRFVRYCDDIKCFVPDNGTGLSVFSNLSSFIESNLHLKINEEKSDVSHYITARYFGYRMSNDDAGFIKLISSTRDHSTWYEQWNKTGLILKDGNINLEEGGILRQKDLTLLFENEETKKYFPIGSLEEINVHSDMTFTSKFFEFINKEEVNINFFDSHGTHIGSFISASTASDASVLIKQCTAYSDPIKRLKYAVIIEKASIQNILTVLRYYRKRKPENMNLSSIILQIEEILQDLSSSKDITTCNTHEARARNLYYRAYSEIINNPKFTFIHRDRRPPKDPVNAMLSFGNTILYNKTRSLITRSRLDDRISFVHSSTTRRKNNLCLDLADIYKPIIVDRTVFTLINKHMITPELHFEPRETDAIYLNPEGRKLFVQHIQNKLATKITDDEDVSRTYLSHIQQDIYDLIKALRNDDPTLFTPFIHRG